MNIIKPRQIATFFAPAERAPADVIQQQSLQFQYPLFPEELMDAVPDIVLILNQHRQIVYSNQAALDLLNLDARHLVNGMRPGEMLDCIHSDEMPGGCGTTEFCRTCGAVRAIISSLRGLESVQECRIIQKSGAALDLQVWTRPMQVKDHTYVVFAVKDISGEKRRQALERIFFHDILNTAGSVAGFAEMLQDATEDEVALIKEGVHQLSRRLIEEIRAQKELTEAENDDLVVRIGTLDSRRVLNDIRLFYERHAVAEDRSIVVDPHSPSVVFNSDGNLLKRVIGNMTKNALEAVDPGAVVLLSCAVAGDEIAFSVHNASYIPREVQLQIFQRSFSTKEPGRGLGTYSMKLLTERYLNGRITFTTSREQGTRFTAFYPLAME